MMKGYWVCIYEKIDNPEKLREYALKAKPAIEKFSGKFLVRGGKHKTFEGDDFIRTVVWEFPSFEKALECHKSEKYQAGWNLAKNTTTRHMQIIEGFSIE